MTFPRPSPIWYHPNRTHSNPCPPQLSQILELVPTIPKLHRVRAMLKGCEYDEGHERDEDSEDDEAEEGGGYGEGERPVRHLTSLQFRS
jgi:hypothetical protein